MNLAIEDYRPLGQTGLRVPPVVFGTAALSNAFRVIPEPMKRAICCEWIKHVPPPVVIDIATNDGTSQALSTMTKVLHRLEIAPEEVVISNRLGSNHDVARGSLDYDTILESWEDECRLLGSNYRPKLVSIDGLDEYIAAADLLNDRERRFQDVFEAHRALAELKQGGRVIGIGATAKDWRIVKEIDAQVSLDWVMLRGAFTIFQHPHDLLTWMDDLAVRQIAVINSSIFQGGFLVGGRCLGDRAIDAENTADKPLLSWRKSFVALCQGHGISPAHASIQFALSAPSVVAVMLNTSHSDRIQENVRLTATKVPNPFWASMKEEGLLAADYPHVG